MISQEKKHKNINLTGCTVLIVHKVINNCLLYVRKSNPLFNLIIHRPDIDKIYLMLMINMKQIINF